MRGKERGMSIMCFRAQEKSLNTYMCMPIEKSAMLHRFRLPVRFRWQGIDQFSMILIDDTYVYIYTFGRRENNGISRLRAVQSTREREYYIRMISNE